MSVNIKDIASLSGVGIATVSRVLNNTGPVSEKTRQKVLDIAGRYNYIPNNNARNLKMVQAENVELIVKYMTNPFFAKMISTIEKEMASRGYPLLIQNAGVTANELDEAISEAISNNLKGVIIMGGSFSSYTEEKFRQLGIPCVLLTVDAREINDQSLFSSVIIDDEKEAYRATRYLIEMGHRNIGFLFRDAEHVVTPNTLRYAGYIRALEESGLKVKESLIASMLPEADGAGYQVGYLGMKELIQKNPDMTALFAFSDVLAIGAAKAALDAGKRIPEDISVLGFDGIEITEYFNPALDTVSQPATQMALSAVSLLEGMLRGEGAQHVVFNSVIKKRGSVAKARDLRDGSQTG